MRTNLKHIVLLLITFFISLGSFAQWDTTWIKTYGGNRDDKAFDIVQSKDNGFLVIGSTSSFGFDNSQMYFLKLDSTGAIMWSKSHGGTGQESGQSVIQTSDGGYFGVGYTNSWGAGGFDFFMVKLDSNGNMEYEDYYGGSDWDFAWDVVEVAPNQYVIAGETQSYGAGSKDGWIIKYNGLTQTVDWDKTVGNNNEDFVKSIIHSFTGDIIGTGGYTHLDSNNLDVLLFALTMDGTQIKWIENYGDSLDDYGNDIILTTDSNYVFTGKNETVTSSRPITLKVDTQQNVIFDERWTAVGPYSYGTCVIERPDGNPAVFGSTRINSVSLDFFYVSMGFNGQGTHGKTFDEYGEKMIRTSSNKYVMTGYTNGFDASFFDIIIMNTDSGEISNYDYNKVMDNTNILGVKSINSKNLQFTFTSTQKTINIQSDFSLEGSSYLIYNSIGQTVLSGSLLSTNKETNITVKNLNQGIYFLSIDSKNNHLSNFSFFINY